MEQQDSCDLMHLKRKVENIEFFFIAWKIWQKGESVVEGQKGIATGLNCPAAIDLNEAIFCLGLEMTVTVRNTHAVKCVYAPFTNSW
jgi:hypothetical protein